MYHLIPIPIIFLAVIVCLVSSRYGLTIFKVISKVVIIICILFFIYTYLDYNGINIIDIVSNFFSNVIEFFRM